MPDPNVSRRKSREYKKLGKSIRAYLKKSGADSITSDVYAQLCRLREESLQKINIWIGDYEKWFLLYEVLMEAYGSSLDETLSALFEDSLAFLIEADERNKWYSRYDAAIFDGRDKIAEEVMFLLFIHGSDTTRLRILSLLFGTFRSATRNVLDGCLINVLETLVEYEHTRKPDSIEILMKYAKEVFCQPTLLHSEHYRINDVLPSILSRLERACEEPTVKSKLQALNETIAKRLSELNERKARSEAESKADAAREERQRKDKESQKWLEDHPDAELDPSRMDR
jgi:hypothetical protein